MLVHRGRKGVKSKFNKKTCKAFTFMELNTKATLPQAQGDAMDVPFINMRFWRVHLGTGATAPPGALKQTPKSPSGVGPLLDLI